MSGSEEGDNSVNYVTTAARSAGLVGLLIALAGSSASAREVRLPLTIEPTVIREAVVRELFNDPQGRAVFWGQPGECSFFYLQDPKVEGDVGRLRVVAHGEARLGTDLGATCLAPIAWGGLLELYEKPRVDGWRLRFDVVDSNLYNEQGEKTLLVGKLWDRIKDSVQPRFSAVTIDVGGPFRDLREFLSAIVAPSNAEEARRAIDSLHPVSVNATPKGIVIEAAFEIAEAPGTAAPSAPEAPLSDAEIGAFTARANQWDAFLTFVIKSLGSRTLSKPARQALLDTLIDARYQIAEALAAPSRNEDPVRRLFLKSWDRLRPVADDIARDLPGADAVAVLTFVAAGDALATLDQVGPSFGIEVSADGLRRMARIVAPTATGDPLEYTPDVDPALRRMFGFGPPLSDTDTSVPNAAPTSWWWNEMPRLSFWTLFDGESAWAETPVDHSSDWKGWLVDEEQEVTAYLKRVEELLNRSASTIAAREKLSRADADLFGKLLPATAWQETCWRQFRTRNGVVTYMRSAQGSVGMLQVSERIWRGFYEVEKLRWKVVYNVESGGDVLLHYLRAADEELGESAKPVPADVMARVVYAAYNGGPAQMRRYLDPKQRGQALTRVVDELFGKKFAAMDGGAVAQVASCLVGGSA